jgi:hypothetical protein
MKTCLNCYTDSSPLWRKGYCNACAIHYQKYKVHKNVEQIYAKILVSLKKGKMLNF